MQANATFTVTRGRDGMTFEWHGPEDGIVAVSEELLATVDVANAVPWKLVRVGHDPAIAAEPKGRPGLVFFRRDNNSALFPQGVEFH